MKHNNGDVVIRPSLNGLTISMVPEQQLTLATTPKKTSGRLLNTLLLVVSLWATPMLSHAATYTSAELIQQTNAVRQQHGLSALTENSALTKAAQAKADDMFAQQYFNHYSPSGQAPWVWFNSQHYVYTSAGENLAIDFVDGSDIVPAWMNSASHRENLLNASYRDIGIAVVDGTMKGQATIIVVQFFGSRYNQTAPISQTEVTSVKPAPSKTVAPVIPTTTAPSVVPAIKTAPTPLQQPTIEIPTIIPPIVTTPIVQQTQLIPVPEVQGVTTEVIHNQVSPVILSSAKTSESTEWLLLGTFCFYLSVISAAAVIRSLLTAKTQKQVLIPQTVTT